MVEVRRRRSSIGGDIERMGIIAIASLLSGA